MSETQSLPCPLTESEIAARSDELAKQVGQLVEIERAKKLANSEFKEKQTVASTAAKALAKQVRDRAEMRDVEIEYRPDDIRFCVDTIRLDTGEVVYSRPMTSDEAHDARQAKLPGIGRGRKGTPSA